MRYRNELQVRAMLVDRLHTAGTQTELAKELGVSPVYISDVLNGRRQPGKTLLRALGYRRVWLVEPDIDAA